MDVAITRLVHLGLLVLLLQSGVAGAVTVQHFTPQGRVGQESRATAVFSADMVKLGDASAPAPFSVNCGQVKGQGRWVNARTWAWQLARPLELGERCEFSVRGGLTALNGEVVTGKGRFEFVASGPWPRSVLPRPGGEVDEEQAFIIDGGAPLKPASVESSIWCEAEGVGNRIPVRLLAEAQRTELLKRLRRHSGQTPVVVSCVERLPAGAKMKLVWGRGVEAQSGAKSEKEESFAFTVRQVFRASLTCEREKAAAPCSPLSAVSVEFTAFTDTELLRKVRIVTPLGARSSGDLEQPGGTRKRTARSVTFPGPFPPDAELTLELPAGIKDDAGRGLANASSFPLKFRTGALPPLAKFPGSFGILELEEGGLLPVTLRNLEPKLGTAFVSLPGTHRFMEQSLTEDGVVIAAMQALAKFEKQTKAVKVMVDGKSEERIDRFYPRELSFLDQRPGVTRQELPKPGGPAEFEVMGIPLAKPGYHIVEIESRLLGAALLAAPKPMYVRAAVLVTNMAVHLKRGTDNTLVWVTALDSGKPVANAEIRVSGCDGREQARGKTDGLGRLLIAGSIAAPACDGDTFVFASARHGADYSFVRSDWNESIEPWRFGVETWGETGELKIHSILDRTLFRPGQTVSMKHIARSRGSRGFGLPAPGGLPDKLTIRHAEAGTEFSQALTWDDRGSALSEWRIPEAVKRGTYQLALSGGKPGMIVSGQFKVADFRLPVFTGSIQGVPGKQIAPSKVPLALGLSFLNGGAAKGAEVAVSALVRPRSPRYPHYERFNFAINFSDEALSAFHVDRSREEEHLLLDSRKLVLDRAGAAKLDVSLRARPKGPSELYAEMRFTDPNGEIQTIHGTVELWPASVVLGINVADWAASKGNTRVQVVVLDTLGKPMPGREIRIVGKRRIDYSHRRRIVGGFYAYENHREFFDLGEVCKGRTDSRGLFLCEPKPTEPGSVDLLAETRDDQGNVARASASYWVTGRGDLWFSAGNQDRIDVIPEKRAYRANETARFQVRTPFREATALVSVEAGGIIESFVQPLSRFNPVIELPVKAAWGPNVFVSVLAVRGRLTPLRWYSFFKWGWREPIAWFKEWWTPLQPTAMVDLAKPAFRLGLAEIAVGTEAFKLDVEVSADKSEYRPREEATVRLRVTTPEGRPAPAGAEIAFAAVDQALLELNPNESWKLLEAMLRKRAYEVETATAQSQVIGKRHFGRKALPSGGGGGRGPTRELFDTLLAWIARVKLDANGTATVKVPMNDSLTEFKLVGVATAGAALFGTGSSAVRTRQDLQLIPGLPPAVRENDRFEALLTLRNGTAKEMNVTLSAKVGDTPLDGRNVKLAPEGAAELAWSALAPEGAGKLVWEFEANDEGGSSAKDRLRITQLVLPAVPVMAQQATFTRIDGKYDMPATAPAGALPGRGGIEIGLSPRLSMPPAELRRFFEEYPFSCIEQLASVAVGLRDQKRWQEVVANLPTYLDGDGLASYFPGAGTGSVALTAYLLNMASLSGFALPDELKNRMLQGLSAFAEGRAKPKHWSPQDDLLVRKLAALEALARHGRAHTRIAAALDVDPMRLPTAGLIDWYLVAKRLPELPQRGAKLEAAERELRNRLSYAGGRLGFTTERTDYWWWMMVSGDSNAFRLIEATLDEPSWSEDLPRLMRGAMERQARGRWFTTTANAWASVVLDKFGAKFEKETLTGVTRATLGKAAVEVAWKADGSQRAPIHLPWPPKAEGSRLVIDHQGAGKPWATVQILAAVPVEKPRAFGYRIARDVTPIQERVAGKVSRGDLWRVTLTVDADQDMTWVVVSDPIIAGARVLGGGDGRDSHIATKDEDARSRRLRPTFVERTFGFFRAYYEVVPKGKFRIDYTVRINNAGEFSLPPSRVEAMYAPDVYGETPNRNVVVQP
jgi:uncharacterized protein YfaS (alpha-2-macroglobulin family)